MSDDAKKRLCAELDVLLSAFSDELAGVELAEVLFATANGFVACEGARPMWLPDEAVVEVPFTSPHELEASLEGFLSTRCVCFVVDGDVPLLTDLTLRVTAGTSAVDFRGRAVQQTAAGTVFQLQPAPVDVQRALVGLPAVLRSHPVEPLKVDRQSTRIPDLLPPDEARRRLAPPPPPPPRAPEPPRVPLRPAAERDPAPPAPPPIVEPRAPEPAPAESTQERVRTSRLAFHAPKIDAAVARIGQQNHFDFLAIHFTADGDAVRAARDELLDLMRQCGEDDVHDELTERLDRLAARLDEAWRVLGNDRVRREYRAAVVEPFQVETAIEMYERQADAAKLSRRIDVAVDCYRRLIELQPSNWDARNQLEALRELDD